MGKAKWLQRGNSLKIVHFCTFAPSGNGQFSTVRDLISAEKAVGIDAGFIDYGYKGKNTIRAGLEDGGLKSLPLDWAFDADLAIRHGAIPQEIERRGIPVITALHGRPESSSMLELYGELPVITEVLKAKEKSNHAGFITFWEEFVSTWHAIAGEEILYVPSPVNLSEYQDAVKNYDFAGKGGKPNIIIADPWRQRRDVTPFNAIMAASLFKDKYAKDAKIHVYALPNEGSLNFLHGLKKTGCLGETRQRVKGLKHIFGSADMLITPFVIATRLIREAMAIGLPFVAGQGCRYTKYNASARNPELFAKEMKRCWEGKDSKKNIALTEKMKAELSIDNVGSILKPILENAISTYKPKPILTAKYTPKWNHMSIRPQDWEDIKEIIKSENIKSVIEFGSGVSTGLFVEHGIKTVSIEAVKQWGINTKKEVPSATIKIWDGKSTLKIRSDMAFIDGPKGGANREPSYKSVAESEINVVACHDNDRPEDRAWIDKYFGSWEVLKETKTLITLKRPKPQVTIVKHNNKGAMKLALIYDKYDHKLQDTSYSWIYKGMFDALIEKFDVEHITENCSAQDINASAILFYDVQSSHHIKIDGIKNHSAIKMEYFIDPQQFEMKGVYKQFNQPVHKLGKKQRVERLFERGIDYLVCPYKDATKLELGEFLKDDIPIWHFPPAPTLGPKPTSLTDRENAVLGNGATHGWDGYCFRKWVFEQSCIKFIPHWIADKGTPSGPDYAEFLSGYTGAIGACSWFAVPKYFEIPLAGCVLFAEHLEEFEGLGFKDYEHCIYINKDNLESVVKDFVNNPESYQKIADAGRKLVEENYTAKHFADFIYNKVKENHV